MSDVKTFLTRTAEPSEMQMLADFMSKFEASQDFRVWTGLIAEESEEVSNAFTAETPAEQLKELADLRYVLVGSALVKPEFLEHIIADTDPIVANFKKADEIAGWVFENHPDAFELGKLEEAFARVHKSNMTKLGEDGKPIRRPDGKILKGPNYAAPDLSDLVA